MKRNCSPVMKKLRVKRKKDKFEKNKKAFSTSFYVQVKFLSTVFSMGKYILFKNKLLLVLEAPERPMITIRRKVVVVTF